MIGRLIKKSQLRILPTVSILTVDFANSMNRFFGKRNIHEHERMPTDGRGGSKEEAFLYVRKIIRKLFPTVGSFWELLELLGSDFRIDILPPRMQLV